MFPDFSYLYEHRTGVEAQFTYLCVCLWWLVFWIGIVAVALLVIGVVISPILVFYFGVDVFSSRQTEEKKTERKNHGTYSMNFPKLEYGLRRPRPSFI